MGHLNFADLAKLSEMVDEMQIIGSTKKEFCEPAHLLSSRRRLVEPLYQQLMGHLIEFILIYLKEENLFPAQLKVISTPQL